MIEALLKPLLIDLTLIAVLDGLQLDSDAATESVVAVLEELGVLVVELILHEVEIVD